MSASTRPSQPDLDALARRISDAMLRDPVIVQRIVDAFTHDALKRRGR